MNEKIEKAKTKVKKFWENNKDKFVKAGIAIGSFTVGALWMGVQLVKTPEFIVGNTLIKGLEKVESLDDPEFGDGYDIGAYGRDTADNSGLISLKTSVKNLGDFGEKLVSCCEADTESEAKIIIGYETAAKTQE